MRIQASNRLRRLPPYLFFEIDSLKRKALDEGRALIDLGIGDPDLPPPQDVIEALYRATCDPKNHRYALDNGHPEFKRRIAEWYRKRFNVELDPEREILPLIGSKEGISHIPLGILNPGESSLVPDPCYPPYKSGTILAGGRFIIMPINEENGFLPDLKGIKKSSLKRAKLLFINYPNNPTAAVCDKGFFRDVVLFSKRNNLIVCHDAAYSEITFDEYRHSSFLSVEGSKEVGIEFHSLSKTCNMTGWRIGFVCGNSKIIELLSRLKSNIDSGIFTAIQIAGITALNIAEGHLKKMNRIYQERRDALVDGLNRLGWEVERPRATFYVWCQLPKGYRSSIQFSKLLLEKTDLVVTPGVGFGNFGEGYIRMALTVSKERIQEAVERIKKIL